MTPLLLGIEIGGTKLQFGVGNGQKDKFLGFVRRDIVRAAGAAGILRQIRETIADLQHQFELTAVTYGFGGPVDRENGTILTSHQVDGWDNFPLAKWTYENTGLKAILANDCDAAALGEATFGAARDHRTAFYVTVGTGIGGGLVIDNRLHGTDRPAAAEIGHLRPGIRSTDPHSTVESMASGLGLEQQVRRLVEAEHDGAAELLRAAGGSLDNISGQLIAELAQRDNPLACSVLEHGNQALGWAIAQVITLIAPDIVVVGGGVSLMPEAIFFTPLRRAVEVYSFGPLVGSCRIVPAQLGEDVVVHGAIANAVQELGSAG